MHRIVSLSAALVDKLSFSPSTILTYLFLKKFHIIENIFLKKYILIYLWLRNGIALLLHYAAGSLTGVCKKN